jgi:hypothetical protein
MYDFNRIYTHTLLATLHNLLLDKFAFKIINT